MTNLKAIEKSIQLLRFVPILGPLYRSAYASLLTAKKLFNLSLYGDQLGALLVKLVVT
jgi:hypothetical protein